MPEPTQIYRYLRTRNLISPIFLNRNLTFMKKRMSRNNEGRKGFKIDSLLDRRTKEDSEMCITNLGSYMTLTFLGYYDQKVKISSSEKAKLELLLVKLCHKKRKESVSPVVQVSQGERIYQVLFPMLTNCGCRHQSSSSQPLRTEPPQQGARPEYSL